MSYKTNINLMVDEPVDMGDARRMGGCIEKLMQMYSDKGIDDVKITAEAVDEKIAYAVSGMKNDNVISDTYMGDDLGVPYRGTRPGKYASMQGEVIKEDAIKHANVLKSIGPGIFTTLTKDEKGTTYASQWEKDGELKVAEYKTVSGNAVFDRMV